MRGLCEWAIRPQILISLLAIALVALLWTFQDRKSREREYAEFVRRSAKREALHARRYGELLDNSSDIVYTHDPEGHLITWSRAGEIITGYSQRDLYGESIIDLAPAERRDSVREWIKAAVAGQGPAIFELVILAKDGCWITLEVSTRDITQEGRQAGVLGFARDITARKRAEKQMQSAREAAEAASRAKSEFLANMSHEIRTPMNGILGMTELALETRLTQEQREYMDMVKVSAQSLLTIINDILDFSKIEAGKLVLDAEEFDIRRLFSGALKPLIVRARQKGVEFALKVSPQVPEALLGDSGRLQQVMTNLVGNAVKFTEQGSISVEISLASLDSRAAVLHFRVTDTGIGITREKQQEIFDPFAQADGSTTRRYGGTGLGLTITRKIVEMMGGQIGVQSEYGQGATFYFTLPFSLPARAGRDDRDDPDELAGPQSALREIVDAPVRLDDFAPPSLAEPSEVRAGPPLRILVAEDSPANLKLVFHLLQKRGYAVKTVSDGKEALAAVESAGPQGFDLVLMDVQMPEMNGFEATAAIRRLEALSGRRLPIIALTAHAMKGDMERCLKAGMDGYVSKPIQRAELIGTIERFVPGAEMRPAVSAAAASLNLPETLARLGGDTGLLGELAQIFLETCPELQQRMNRAVAELDCDSLQGAVHTLKSSLGVFYARPAMQALAALEENIPSRDAQRINQAHDNLTAEIARLMPALANLLQAREENSHLSLPSLKSQTTIAH
ncbi:MAG: ATP-binding protein [Terriglobia bacterium]